LQEGHKMDRFSATAHVSTEYSHWNLNEIGIGGHTVKVARQI
jgi:hypothetical protein